MYEAGLLPPDIEEAVGGVYRDTLMGHHQLPEIEDEAQFSEMCRIVERDSGRSAEEVKAVAVLQLA